MKFLSKHRNKIIIILIAIVLLVVSFFMGGNGKVNENVVNRENTASKVAESVDKAPIQTEKIADNIITTNSAEPTQTESKPEKTDEPKVTEKAETKNEEQSVEESSDVVQVVQNPNPTEMKSESADGELYCSLVVRCDKAIENAERLADGKREVLPDNGMIYSEQSVVFYEGENVFNVLLREMKKNRIHFEFINPPLYNSVYIEGINNLYEFDCGELSGWMYKVNDIFPSYGCSMYELKSGDRIEFIYTCDLGRDIGGDKRQWDNRESD